MNGYVRFSRSLFTDPVFLDMPPAWQMLYMHLVNLAAYEPREVSDDGVRIFLKPGQLCYSIRKLAEICGPHISKKQVEKALVFFQKVDFWGQERGHRRNIITCLHKETYDYIVNGKGTSQGTSGGQVGDISNTVYTLEDKKDKTPQPPIASAIGGVSGLDLSDIQVGGLTKQMDIAGPAQHNIKNYPTTRGRKPRKSNPKVEPLPIAKWAFEQYKSVCEIAKEPDWFVWNKHYGALIDQGYLEEDMKAVVTWITSIWDDPFCPQSALRYPSRMSERFEEYFNRRTKKPKSNPNTVDRRHLNPDGTPVENEFLKVW